MPSIGAEVTNPPSTPNPDPTTLTTASLLREIGQLEQQVSRRFGSERELFEQRFTSVEQHFLWIDSLRLEQKVDNTKTVDIAFAAAKEAIAGVAIIVTDLKDRVVALESRQLGGKEQRTESRGNNNLLLAGVGVAFTAAMVVIAILTFVGR